MKQLFITLIVIISGAFTAAPMYALNDGTQTVNYQVNQPNSTTPSIANDYFVKPATVTTKDGSHTVQLTLNNSSWITAFTPPGGATVISEDKTSDKRVVQFTVKDLSQPVITKIKVDVEDINYHHDYSISIAFDANSEKVAATTASTTSPASTATSAVAEKNPQTSDTTPYIIILLVVTSGLLLYRNQKTKVEV